MKIYRCKIHDRPYTGCPDCGCQYCGLIWIGGCPRRSWHPAHAEGEAEAGRRYRALELARQQSARNRGEIR